METFCKVELSLMAIRSWESLNVLHTFSRLSGKVASPENQIPDHLTVFEHKKTKRNGNHLKPQSTKTKQKRSKPLTTH